MEKTIETFLGKYRINLDPEHAIESYYLEHGSWETHVVSFINYFLKEGNIGVDVGANSGFHTIAMADRVGEPGKVYAFEPDSKSVNRLTRNLSLNPELVNRVIVENQGLSDSPGELKLFASGQKMGNAYMSKEYDPNLWNSGSPDDYEVCPVTTLDQYFQNALVHFLKVDVEGMELDVLRGGQNLLSRCKPVIVFETLVEHFNKQKIQILELLLRNFGYQLFYFEASVSKIAPTTFPHFQEDTLALHESQLIRYSDILAAAIRYECGTALGNNSPLYLTATNVFPEQLIAGLHFGNDPMPTSSKTSWQSNFLVFENDNYRILFDGIEFQAGRAIGKEKGMCTLQPKNGAQETKIEMRKVGGSLIHPLRTKR